MTDLKWLLFSALASWLMLLIAAGLRTGGFSSVPGFWAGLGNRDDLPPASKLSQRADRAARNMLENLLLFACAFFAARAAQPSPAALTGPAQLFFFARVAYFGVYVIGIPYLRTAVWAVGVYATLTLALLVWR